MTEDWHRGWQGQRDDRLILGKCAEGSRDSAGSGVAYWRTRSLALTARQSEDSFKLRMTEMGYKSRSADLEEIALSGTVTPDSATQQRGIKTGDSWTAHLCARSSRAWMGRASTSFDTA